MTKLRVLLLLASSVLLAACGGGGGAAVPLPGNPTAPGGSVGDPLPLVINGAGGSGLADLSISEGVPQGAVTTYIGQKVKIKGEGFSEGMRLFFGMNNDLAREADSLLTADAADLPTGPFTYTDPDTATETILEVEADFTFISETEVEVTIPPALSCTPDFSPAGGPVLRVTDENGSSEPVTGVLFIVGPEAIAVDRNRGPEAGGYSVVLYGSRFTRNTQIAIRLTDPSSGDTRVLGDGDTSNGALNADDDIAEQLVDGNTIVIPNWPTPGAPLSAELVVDILVFENIESIAANDAALGRACEDLEPEGDVELNAKGSRNFELTSAFTYLPATATGLPVVTSVSPSSGSVVGGDVAVVRGSGFDGDTIDLANGGLRVEIPAGSGQFFAPVAATLVDGGTLLVTMPAAPGNDNVKASLWLRNRFSIDTYGSGADSSIPFANVFTYAPVAPVKAPALTVVSGTPSDAGSQRLVLLGDRFDATTAVQLLHDGKTYDAERVILRDERVLEVFLPRLDAPLATDATASLRITNAHGPADFVDVLTIKATPDAGATPTLSAISPSGGPIGGGNRVLVRGTNFDTTTTVRFGANESPRVEFVSATLLIATVPAAGAEGNVDVTVIDDGAESAAQAYEYGAPAVGPQVATVESGTGHDAGGYAVVLRGTGFGPTTEVEFGGGSGNKAAVTFINPTCLHVVVPAALGSQEGTAVALRAYDALAGAGPDGAEFNYVAEAAAVVTTIDTTAGGDADLYAHGGDRVLVAGSGFDVNSIFEVTLDSTVRTGTNVHLLGPGLAVFSSPSAAGDAGAATLAVRGLGVLSDDTDAEYIAVPAPEICEVGNLAGTGRSASDGETLVIFGDFFFDTGADPLTVRLTGTEAGGTDPKTVAFSGVALRLIDDSIIALRIPPGTFQPGKLEVEVETASGKASFEENGQPVFTLDGPQAPRVDRVSPDLVTSGGGTFVVFTGRHLTTTTTLFVRTTRRDTFQPVLGLRIVSDTLATGFLPPMLGGLPPQGVPGIVRAEEVDATRAAAIDGDPFTESSVGNPLFRVIDESAPALLTVVPGRGSIAGGEQVLMFGDGFLGTDGRPNIDRIVFRHPDLGPVEYERVSSIEAPLVALPGGANNGKFMVVNDSTIVLITKARPPILFGDTLPVDVEVHGLPGNSILAGAFTYENTPAVRTPVLAGITPNEVRRNGGSSHLVSGGFLTEVDRLVITKPGSAARVVIPRADFKEVNDFFVVFEMPDLRGSFEVLDKLTLRAEKDVTGNPERLVSNALNEVLTVTFAGPPSIVIEQGAVPAEGSSFGGTVVTLKGDLFTTNTQVLIGTRRASIVVVEDENTLRFVVPSLPIDAPADGLDLLNVHEENRDKTADLAVFTQGGWAVLADAFTFETEAPEVDSISPDRGIEGSTTRITMRGKRFLPGLTIEPLLDGETGAKAGTVKNVTWVSLTEVTFDYTAPVPARGTLGPLEIVFRVTTNHGSALSPPFLVELSPFIDGIERLDGKDDLTVPTTGVENGTRVIYEITGGNFAAGASLKVVTRLGARLELTEVDTLDKAGQFVLLSPTKIRFTVPFAFGNDTPTLIEGNPNVGTTGLEFQNANGLDAELEKAFTYVPVVLDFDGFAFRIPTGVALDAVPHELTIGDINNDGIPDAAMMVRAGSPDVTKPEVYVFIADTFGDVDVNGDGVTPDFAGTFTKHIINDLTLRTEAGFLGRGGTVLLGNFDDDDELELAVPARVASNTNAVRVLIADYDATNKKFVAKKILTADGPKSDAVGGIAIGNFDDTTDHDDIALIVEDIAKTKRRLTIYKSTGAFTFDQFSTELPTDCCGGRVGFLAAGNFDGQGADELIWAHTDWSTGKKTKDWPVVVATINGGAETVDLDPLTNFTGGEIHDIDVFDHDNDGKESVALIVQDEAVLDGKTRPGGVAIILDPMSLKVSSYIETAFNGNGRALGAGDVDGDGIVDLVAGNTLGKFFVLIGSKDGTFTDGAQSWFLPIIPESFPTRMENIGVADLNGDGLGEIWIGDIGSAPTSLQIFLNTSR